MKIVLDPPITKTSQKLYPTLVKKIESDSKSRKSYLYPDTKPIPKIILDPNHKNTMKIIPEPITKIVSDRGHPNVMKIIPDPSHENRTRPRSPKRHENHKCNNMNLIPTIKNKK